MAGPALRYHVAPLPSWFENMADHIIFRNAGSLHLSAKAEAVSPGAFQVKAGTDLGAVVCVDAVHRLKD